MQIHPLPSDTARLVDANKAICQNRYLLLNRYTPTESIESPQISPELRRTVFEQITRTNGLDPKPHLERARSMLHGLESSGYYVSQLRMQTNTRLVVGLGQGGTLEAGLSLHPVYGYPYIPSTAIKGLTRAWLEVAEDSFGGQVLEGDTLEDQLFKEAHEVFGSADKDERWSGKLSPTEQEKYKKLLDSQRGEVLFFDAVPVSAPTLEIDIMNPHYQPYYTKPAENPPGDWYSPNPITFLTVAPGSVFFFGLASKNKAALEKAESWLKSGLSELGIGAKTSAGYGYFDAMSMEELEEQKAQEESEAVTKEIERLKAVAAEAAANVTSPLDRVYQNLEIIRKEQIQKLLYNPWKEIEDEGDKIKAAKAIVDKFSKQINKKKQKTFAKELLEWASKSKS